MTKELFERANESLLQPGKSEWGAKDFPFAGYITCGGCGLKLIGEEKIKQLKDGSTRRYVYYHCSRHTKSDCDEPYIREERLIQELIQIVNPCILVSKPELTDEFARVVNTAKEMNNRISDNSVITEYLHTTIKSGTSIQRKVIMNSLNVNLHLDNLKLISNINQAVRL